MSFVGAHSLLARTFEIIQNLAIILQVSKGDGMPR